MLKLRVLGFGFLLGDTVLAFTHLYNLSGSSCNEEHNNCESIIIFFRKRVLQNLAPPCQHLSSLFQDLSDRVRLCLEKVEDSVQALLFTCPRQWEGN